MASSMEFTVLTPVTSESVVPHWVGAVTNLVHHSEEGSLSDVAHGLGQVDDFGVFAVKGAGWHTSSTGISCPTVHDDRC